MAESALHPWNPWYSTARPYPGDNLLLSPWWIGAIVAGSLIFLAILIIILILLCRQTSGTVCFNPEFCWNCCVTCQCRRRRRDVQPYRRRRGRRRFEPRYPAGYVPHATRIKPRRYTDNGSYIDGGSLNGGYVDDYDDNISVISASRIRRQQILDDQFHYDGQQHVVVDDHYYVVDTSNVDMYGSRPIHSASIQMESCFGHGGCP